MSDITTKSLHYRISNSGIVFVSILQIVDTLKAYIFAGINLRGFRGFSGF